MKTSFGLTLLYSAFLVSAAVAGGGSGDGPDGDLILMSLEDGLTVGVNALETADDTGIGGTSTSSFSVENSVLVWEGTVGELGDNGDVGFCNLETSSFIGLVEDREDLADDYSGVAVFVAEDNSSYPSPLKAVIKTTDTPEGVAYVATLVERSRVADTNIVEYYADWRAFRLASRDPTNTNVNPIRLEEEDAYKATYVGVSVDAEAGDFRVEMTMIMLREDPSWWRQYWWVGVILLVIFIGASVGLFVYCRRRRLRRQEEAAEFGKDFSVPAEAIVVEGVPPDAGGLVKPSVYDNRTVSSHGSGSSKGSGGSNGNGSSKGIRGSNKVKDLV